MEQNASPSQRNRELLDSLLRKGNGSLEETPYALLLLGMALRESSGVLELKRNQLEKSIVFDNGSPVECRSNIATEMLGRYLVSTGKINETDCNVAFATAAARGIPIGEVLIERKLLTPTELYRALQQNLGRKLLEPFSWKSGTWSISSDPLPMASVLRVKVPQLLVTGILKVEPQETADQAAGMSEGKYLALSDDPLFGLEHLRLSADQKKVVEASRRGVKLSDLRATSGIDTDDLHRIVYALFLLGLLVVRDEPLPEVIPVELDNPFAAVTVEEEIPIVVTPIENPFAAPPTPTIEQPAPKPVAAPVPAPAPAPVPAPVAFEPARPYIEPASAEEVMGAYLSCRRKDAFDLLGVEESDTVSAFQQSFLSMTEKFLPSKFDKEEVKEKAQEVFLAAARAYAELADADRRNALIAKRQKLREEAANATSRGQARMIDPEALCQSGRTLAAAGKFRDALSSFELAAECDAQNGTYAAEAAWMRFQLKVTPPANALKMLKNAIRIDPNSGVAHLYAGQVQAALGNKLEGEAYLGRAATLLKGDPRPAEALRALRAS